MPQKTFIYASLFSSASLKMGRTKETRTWGRAGERHLCLISGSGGQAHAYLQCLILSLCVSVWSGGLEVRLEEAGGRILTCLPGSGEGDLALHFET